MDDQPLDRPPAPGFRDRLRALLTPVELPTMVVDLATYRRLRAMQERMTAEDPTLGEETDGGFEHVIYAAICGGLCDSEKRAGVTFNENTGMEITDREETR